MILECSFEELSALTSTAERVLASAEAGGGVAAPPETIAEIEALVPRLTGDLSVRTLGDQLALERALEYMLAELKDRMNEFVLTRYPGADDAVNAYFDYAHVLVVLGRVRDLGEEMETMLELMTGASPTGEAARTVEFPD